jgi:glucuronate isomerase
VKSDRLVLHPDRLFSSDPRQREIARELYGAISALPIVSPHGHTDPAWFADNESFADPASLLVTPDHYLTRMLYSQGVPLDTLGIAGSSGQDQPEPRAVWRTFATHFRLFDGTPSGLWFNHVLVEVFGIDRRLSIVSAVSIYDSIAARLADDAYRPRALLDRFRIEALATTDSPLSDLAHHQKLVADGYADRVIPTFRPDTVVDPDHERFVSNLEFLGELTGRDTTKWGDYLAALFDRRKFAISLGATATDHGPPSANTADLEARAAQTLLDRALAGTLDASGAELFRSQLLLEMAAMSAEDGLVMQLHAGSHRNHNHPLFQRFGRDVGADIPGPTNYVDGLRPLLNRFGNDPRFRLVVFTLDESTFSRELAPLAGHYPAMMLGPPWWFLDSVEGMLRFRRSVTETTGFANLTGFVDDTRAFLSIPARHDVARRVDCRYLAELVSDHRLDLDQAHDIAIDIAGAASRRAFNIGSKEQLG